jgi:Calreticulin family
MCTTTYCYEQDWVDEARIIDHTAVKPEGYDDIPEHLPDPDAVKPDVWDEVMYYTLCILRTI